MKKYILILCCLLAAWSCKLDGSYYVENTQDFVTLIDGVLANDNGVIYTLQSVASDKVPVPAVNGQRYFLVFDILDANLNILLKNSLTVPVMPALPAGEVVPPYDDPVNVGIYNIGPKYLNLGLTYYRAKNSDFSHTFQVQYAREAATNELNLYLYHGGNHENPAEVEDASTLETAVQMLSIPYGIYGWDPSGITLTVHILQKDGSGNWTVVQQTYGGNQ